jgi:hypothetical protein
MPDIRFITSLDVSCHSGRAWCVCQEPTQDHCCQHCCKHESQKQCLQLLETYLFHCCCHLSTTREYHPTNAIVRTAMKMPVLLLSLQASPRTHGLRHTLRSGPNRHPRKMLDGLHTETRLAHSKPKPTGKMMCGERQELSQTNSSVDTVRNAVRALEDVSFFDARQYTRCEKCARAMASLQLHRRGYMQHM